MIPDIPKIEGLDEHQVLTLAYCRSYNQYVSMIEQYRAGRCAFCDPLDPVKNKLIHENMLWRLWVNPFPLPHTELHLVMASRRHIAPGGEMTAEDFTAMGQLFLQAQMTYGFTGGGFVMRFGTPLQSAGTILHLHANIIIPDRSGAVEVTLAKDHATIVEQIARMRVFEKLRLKVEWSELSPEEAKLVIGRY